MDKMNCPKCGHDDYIRERSPNGNTRCTFCNFKTSNSNWDSLVAAKNKRRLPVARIVTFTKKVESCDECPFKAHHQGHGENWDYCNHPQGPSGFDSIIEDKLPPFCPGEDVF